MADNAFQVNLRSSPMEIEHHTVLNAVSRAIILVDSDTEQAKDGLYALGDYLKYYFSATVRRQTPPSPQDLERVRESLQELQRFIGKDQG
jgi:hypothetical protein